MTLRSSPGGNPNDTETVHCPECFLGVTVYKWSFAGTGKKCSQCGYLITQFNEGRPGERLKERTERPREVQ